MRIRVIQKPSVSCIDGIQLDDFRPGLQYEVGNSIGALFLAEGWAVPEPDEAPALLIPLTEFEPDRRTDDPPNMIREHYPPYYEGPAALAADRRHRPRKRVL